MNPLNKIPRAATNPRLTIINFKSKTNNFVLFPTNYKPQFNFNRKEPTYSACNFQ